MLKFSCRYCGHTIVTEPSQPGTVVACRSCGVKNEVPEGAALATSAEREEYLGRRSAADSSATPGSAATASGIVGLLEALAWIFLVLAVLGVASIWMFIQGAAAIALSIAFLLQGLFTFAVSRVFCLIARDVASIREEIESARARSN